MTWLRLLLDRFHRWQERRWRAEYRRMVLPKPDPKTLDSLGQERLQTHVRTRPDLN